MLRDVDEASAWYSGDPARLEMFYGGAAPSAKTGQRSWVRFWSRRASDATGSGRQRLHVPLAGDLASTSADLLFGDEPSIVIPEAHEETADPDAKASEDYLREMLDRDSVYSKLLEAAEISAALGGVYLRPVWDRAVADRALLSMVHPDSAVPEFRWGVLVAVTFWRVLQGSGRDEVWRHLERHEVGVVLHGLYRGGKDSLGVRLPLEAHPDTAMLEADDEGRIVLPEGIDGLAVRYVPNVLPNRRHRGIPAGRPDGQGSEGLMDSLDETFTSWMRDVRLGKRRIVVPDEFLERKGRGRGAQFDVDQEIFSPLEMDPKSMEKAGITLVDFAIRTEDHAKAMLGIIERIVTAGGYAPQTFGLRSSDAGDMTATEVRARENKSMRTRGRKGRYFTTAALPDVFEMMMVLDRQVFGVQVTPMRPRVSLAEQGDDPKVRAETLDLFARAQAMSVETRVRWAQPDLDEPQVQAEVARILAETGALVADPTGFGDGGEDE